MGTHAFKIEPAGKVKLQTTDPSYNGRFKSKEDAAEETAKHLERLAEVEERLYASGSHALLVVLAGPMDTRRQGTGHQARRPRLQPAGRPGHLVQGTSEEERAHDFLWRVHKRYPAGHGRRVQRSPTTRRCSWYGSAKLAAQGGWTRHYDHITSSRSLARRAA